MTGFIHSFGERALVNDLIINKVLGFQQRKLFDKSEERRVNNLIHLLFPVCQYRGNHSYIMWRFLVGQFGVLETGKVSYCPFGLYLS